MLRPQNSARFRSLIRDRWWAAWLAISLLFPACAGDTPGFKCYVSPQGNDRWSGKLPAPNRARTDGPFASLERARDEIRRLKSAGWPRGGATVYLRGGTYTLTHAFDLTAADSGASNAPVVYRAFLQEQPCMTGARVITNFTAHAGNILKADMAAAGLTGVYFRQLLFNGRRLPLARHPNFDARDPYYSGWAYVDGPLIPANLDLPLDTRRMLRFKPGDVHASAHPDDGEVFIFPRFNWQNNLLSVTRVDQDGKYLVLANDTSYAIRSGDRYYVQNYLEDLDSPGEWFLDRRTWTLYLWPPSAITNAQVRAPTLQNLVRLTPGTAELTLRGLTFEGCAGTAITLSGATNCLVAGNVIRNAGHIKGAGVSIEGGRGNGVVGNDIFETGSHGISISGGEVRALTAALNYADNNYIHHVGVYNKVAAGIYLSGVGNRASHNLIHDGPRFGVEFLGNNLIIEYNHIRHVDAETADTGGIYTIGRDWISSRGSVVRGNYLHDMLGYGRDGTNWISPYYTWGIYLDDCAGGVDVIGNVVARAPRGLIHLNNARDARIENNILVGGGFAQLEANGWLANNSTWRRNLPEMIRGYESVAGAAAWQQMRNMNLHPTNAALADGRVMTGNVFCRNILYDQGSPAKSYKLVNVAWDHFVCDSNLVYHGGQPVALEITPATDGRPVIDWAEWQKRGFDRQSLVADPQFVDPDKDDFRLRSTSPALRLGFEPIPFENIGPYRDPLRATWPIQEARGIREQMRQKEVQ